MIAKLKCVQIDCHAPEEWEGGDPDGMKTVHLAPVTSKDPEDAEDYAFGQATPAGSVELRMTHDAAGFFEPGETVYVTFSAERPALPAP